MNQEKSWDEIAAFFDIPEDVVYLNNGSFGPCPRPAVEEAISLLRKLESNPQRYLSEYREETKTVKGALGEFLGMEPQDFVFVTNVTVGMNMAARGLRCIRQGTEVLTTDQEYGAVDKIWRFVADRRDARIVRAELPVPPPDATAVEEAITRHITENTRLLVFSHITSRTGTILPVRNICNKARNSGVVTVIDGAHAPGMIPLDIESLGCDIYIGNCHKWLCAPKGVGFLWASSHVQNQLDPLIVGWGWDDKDGSFLGNFENPGTHNPSLYLAVMQCVEFQKSIGCHRIAQRGRELAQYARRVLLARPGVTPLTPASEDMSCSMAAYGLPALLGGDLATVLKQRNIVVPAQADANGGRMRVSTHIYNSFSHIDVLANAIDEAYRYQETRSDPPV